MSYKLVLSTCPDLPSAHKIAEGLIELQLAACVNILPSVVSIYKWQGKVEQNTEVKLFIKTDGTKSQEVVSFIGQNHPYDVPEAVCIDIESGNSEYLAWISSTLKED